MLTKSLKDFLTIRPYEAVLPTNLNCSVSILKNGYFRVILRNKNRQSSKLKKIKFLWWTIEDYARTFLCCSGLRT